MARYGEERRKRREQLQHNHGRVRGSAKYVGARLRELLPGGGR